MTDRDLMQQALDALLALRYRSLKDEPDGVITALRDRLAHCDRCGKKLGGEGDIHTCTPGPIGDAQDKLIAEMAAQPKQEPVACLSKTQAKTILGLALDLEKTGRMVVLTKGQERTDFAARNRNIQCALEDALRNATTPPAAAQQEPVAFDDWPEYREHAMGCGLEDRGITDRYEAMRYGWDEALERAWKAVNLHGPLYATPPAAPAAAQRQPLEPVVPEGKEIYHLPAFRLGWKTAEAAHGIKEKT
jgi:hypothetical protein